MRLMRGFSDEAEIEGRVSDADRARHERQVLKRRVQEARRTTRWAELEEVDLFERGRGLLVSATTDAVYTPYRGVVFAPHSTDVIADQAPLYFYVRDDDQLVFLEKQQGSWSDRVARQARKEARAKA